MKGFTAKSLFPKFLILSLFFLGCSSDKTTLEDIEKNLKEIIEKAGPSIVFISAKNNDLNLTKYGVGVVLGEGHILTLENILQNVDEINITLQNGEVIGDSEITEISCDFETNVSILKVKKKDLKPVKLAKRVEGGSLGIVLGNTKYSKGLQASLGTVGNSWIGGVDGYDKNLLLLNIPCSVYYSGTPVFNARGELLGLIEGQVMGEKDLVLLLPATTCQEVSDILKENGEVKRGWIGIRSEIGGKDFAGEKGVVITEVFGGSPAFYAGLKKGDLVISCQGNPIKTKLELKKMISRLKKGSEVTFTLIRDGKRLQKKVVVQEAKEILRQRRCPDKSI